MENNNDVKKMSFFNSFAFLDREEKKALISENRRLTENLKNATDTIAQYFHQIEVEKIRTEKAIDALDEQLKTEQSRLENYMFAENMNSRLLKERVAKLEIDLQNEKNDNARLRKVKEERN